MANSSAFRDHFEEVRRHSDIVEVVGQYVELSSSGMGRCPFHDDSTPSLSVHAEDQYFHCFGCGAGGDVFRFIEKIERVGFNGAVRILADLAGVARYTGNEEDAADAQARRDVEDVLEVAAAYYHRQLTPEALAHLTRDRGIPQEINDRFQPGWADGGLGDHLREKGISEEAGIKAGVLINKDGRFRDYFYKRIVFPVRRRGSVIFMTGRALGDGKPPWLHLAGERPLLFNEAALRSDQVIVTEGVLDALALETWGFSAVALLGTGSNPEKIAQRLQRVSQVFVCLDPDDAGRRGALKLGRSLGLKARIIELPEGKDPNDLLVAGEREVFERCVADARDPIAWQVEAIPADTDKVQLRDELNPVLEVLAGLDPVKAEAILAGQVKKRFGLKAKEVELYRKATKKKWLAHRKSERKAGAEAGRPGKYFADERGTFLRKETRDGPAEVLLANFRATITDFVIEDDGVEPRLNYQVKVEGRHGTRTVQVPGSSFASMAWVQELGPRWILEAGQSLRDHFRAAIQHLSPESKCTVRFTHLGWREIEGHGSCYLSASGPIGPNGPVSDIEVWLDGPLAGYSLSLPVSDMDEVEAHRTALRLLELAPDEVSFPLFAMVWRAVLGGTDFSGFLVGPTGTRKTASAAVFQSFWGAGLDERHLPGSWSSTANFLEIQAFQAKDALMVADDFAPTGSSGDIQRYHRNADRLLRGQGNLAGRGRLRRDGTLQPVRAPRGLILSTGEDIPIGQSLRARAFILEISPDTIDLAVLTTCQQAAREGVLAKAMGSFVKWVAPHYPKVLATLKTNVPDLRSTFQVDGHHGRTVTIAAELMAGFDAWRVYAELKGVITNEKGERLRKRCLAALRATVIAQASHVTSSEPARRFLELLGSAISSGEAHLAYPNGEAPLNDSPEAWGWRQDSPGSCDWRSRGTQVGWVRGEDLYLEPAAALKAAQRMAVGSDGLTVTETTLGKRLAERGLLCSQDSSRDRLRARVWLQGKRRAVWHLRAEALLQIPAQPALPGCEDQKEGPVGGSGPEPWADSVASAEETGPENRPTEGEPGIQPGPKEGEGPDGPVGPVLEGRESSGMVTFLPPPSGPCRVCGKSRWWRGESRRTWACGICHPPAAALEQVVWSDDPETDSVEAEGGAK